MTFMFHLGRARARARARARVRAKARAKARARARARIESGFMFHRPRMMSSPRPTVYGRYLYRAVSACCSGLVVSRGSSGSGVYSWKPRTPHSSVMLHTAARSWPCGGAP